MESPRVPRLVQSRQEFLRRVLHAVLLPCARDSTQESALRLFSAADKMELRVVVTNLFTVYGIGQGVPLFSAGLTTESPP